MEDVEKRLRDSSEQCVTSYVAWKADQKSGEVRGTLHEAIHELRKVASRLEIELAISERDQQGFKPMAIPPHRDAQNRNHDIEHDMPNFNNADNENTHKPAPRRLQRRSENPGNNGGPRRHQGQGHTPGHSGGPNRRPNRDDQT